MKSAKRFISVAVAFIFLCGISGCNKKEDDKTSPFYIEFLYAEKSQPLYIHLKDGTNILVDLGTEKETDLFIVRHNLKTVDYLFLTDNNINRYGAYKHLLENVTVNNIYLPYFTDDNILKSYDVYQYLTEKGISYGYTDIAFRLEKAGASISCLSPSAYKSPNGEYATVSVTGQVKNIMPVFYILYLGKRILLSSGIDNNTEKRILSNYSAGLYNNIDLSFVNIMRLSACDYEVSDTFVDNVPTKIAVSHIDASNNSGNPYTSVLQKLDQSEVYMTRNVGTVRYTVYDDGKEDISVI